MSDSIEHKLAITEKIYQYSRAMDRIDDRLGYDVFHEDATVDYGEMFQGTGHEFIDFVHKAHSTMLVHQHMIGNILIELDGDRAGSESYVTATFRIRQDDGTLMGMRSQGRYIDRWERRGDAWRILHRQYLHEMDESWPAVQQFVSRGQRETSDPSYAVLAGSPEESQK